MNRTWMPVPVLLLLGLFVSGPASAHGGCHTTGYTPCYYTPCYTPCYYPPCYPCYPGTITAGSIIVVVSPSQGVLTEPKVKIGGVDAKQVDGYPIFVSVDPLDVNKEFKVEVTGKIDGKPVAKPVEVMTKGNTTIHVILKP